MILNRGVGILSIILVAIGVHGKITDEEYASMPELFHLDNFDRCMFLGDKALYCWMTIQLGPSESNYSKTWKIVKEISSDERKYRHDQLRYGVCIPHSCPNITYNISDYKNNDKELKDAISKCYTEKFENVAMTGRVTKLHCETNKPYYTVDIYDKLVAFSLATLFAVIIFASFYEGTARYKTKEEYERITRSSFGKIVTCFSIIKNWERLGKMNTDPEMIPLKFINGMRFYNMFLVIMVHTCMVVLASPISNPQFTEKMTEGWDYMLVLNGIYAVQTFFLISGLLLSYNIFLIIEKGKEFKFRYIWLAFFNRYIRLTPCLLVVTAFSATWMYHMHRGPLWDKLVGDEYRNCRKNWWANLLYINNYYDTEHMCLIHAWYLAADTQLFALSLIILAFLWKYTKYTKPVFGACFLISLVIPGIVSYVNDFDIVVRNYPEPLYRIVLDVPQWKITYITSYDNTISSVMGLILGYVIFKYRNRKVFTKKIYVVVWWILTWGLPLGIIYLGVPLYKESFVHSRLGAAIHASIAKMTFLLGLFLACFGMSQGIGWWLRDACVWPPLQILGRLTYCVYLIHVALIRIRRGISRSPSFVDPYGFFANTIGDLTMSYILGLILCLLIEMPISALQKLMVPQVSNKKQDVPESSVGKVAPVSAVNGDQISKV